jgi:hypothetical protein
MASFIQTGDLAAHLHQKIAVELLIEEGADLQDVAGKDLAFSSDFVFQCFHSLSAFRKNKKQDPIM